ncbi:sigma-70 family RNA polymerase sigma factor [Vibrio hannami]|uniref:sigma-70 family RNA polymerase sigma factor n=1 Tax=Vibrio hannami TaxID=2717094 RepID=UPI002410699B|nr:sigma-70 family RNA polymerase sigma factor [Vibrio hannami]MDG3086870.1 sigma-70 family RNA polymerase sigma factor [Vibrio hannami]
MSNSEFLVQEGAFPCAMRAWSQHEQILLQWLLKETHDKELSQDLLQEVFIKVMQQREQFCSVDNTKAWLFRVAQNLLIDQIRKDRYQPMDDNAERPEEEEHYDAIDLLALSCLPRSLSELDQASREVITACDLQGMNQQDYAIQHGLTLPAVKSRLRRAREKLKQQIEASCNVKLDDNQNICCFTTRT